MISNILREARNYEEIMEQLIPDHARPSFHLSSRVGWMNDPNGFSYYQGKYHLFYQYYPYESKWGPMHWGHAVSEDLLHWEYLPAASRRTPSPIRTGAFREARWSWPTADIFCCTQGSSKALFVRMEPAMTRRHSVLRWETVLTMKNIPAIPF